MRDQFGRNLWASAISITSGVAPTVLLTRLVTSAVSGLAGIIKFVEFKPVWLFVVDWASRFCLSIEPPALMHHVHCFPTDSLGDTCFLGDICWSDMFPLLESFRQGKTPDFITFCWFCHYAYLIMVLLNTLAAETHVSLMASSRDCAVRLLISLLGILAQFHVYRRQMRQPLSRPGCSSGGIRALLRERLIRRRVGG